MIYSRSGCNFINTHFLYGLIWAVLAISAMQACKSADGESPAAKNQKIQTGVTAIGALSDVMQKGILYGSLNLDSIENKTGLYGLGPLEFLRGELMILDGRSYISKVMNDSTVLVGQSFGVNAPFFVYTNVEQWSEELIAQDIISLVDLENFLEQRSRTAEGAFVFRLTGTVKDAQVHIQNLPPGAQVTSPEEVHQGQENFDLADREVEIVGFYSTGHQGIFTHHDSKIHAHLLTVDRKMMGHLDDLAFEAQGMTLYLPVTVTD